MNPQDAIREGLKYGGQNLEHSARQAQEYLLGCANWLVALEGNWETPFAIDLRVEVECGKPHLIYACVTIEQSMHVREKRFSEKLHYRYPLINVLRAAQEHIIDCHKENRQKSYTEEQDEAALKELNELAQRADAIGWALVRKDEAERGAVQAFPVTGKEKEGQ